MENHMTKKELVEEVERLRVRVEVLESMSRYYWTMPLERERGSYPGWGPLYKVTCQHSYSSPTQADVLT